MAQVSHREQLIGGAISCLQAKGYARTTARDIAAASGANLASIGYHFGSKEALLNEALIRVLEERNRHLGQVSASAEDATPLERLSTLFVAVRELFETHRPLLVAFVEAMAQAERSTQLREEMASHYRDGRRGIAAMLRATVGDDLHADAELAASLLMAVFDGLVLQYLLEPGATPGGDDLVASLARTMARALEHDGAHDARGAQPRSAL